MMVTVSVLSGLTKAYRSVMSAVGSLAMPGASRVAGGESAAAYRSDRHEPDGSSDGSEMDQATLGDLMGFQAG